MTSGLTYALAVWILIGAFCGWLETRRAAGNDWLVANIMIGSLGAIIAGVIFKNIGELGPPWQGPIYSAFIGAAISITIVSYVLKRVRPSN